MLHPGARWLFRLKAYFSLIVPLLFLTAWSSSFIFTIGLKSSGATYLFLAIIFIIIIFLILVLIIGEIYARMAYNRWFYEFTPENLKLERGIIWKKYSNVPYERIQNVDVTRGILARLLGFSTLSIQTAGYSGGNGRYASMQSEGYIPAVSTEVAEKIRDYVISKISKNHKSHQGL